MQTDIFSFSQKSCKKIRRGGAKEYGACCNFLHGMQKTHAPCKKIVQRSAKEFCKKPMKYRQEKTKKKAGLVRFAQNTCEIKRQNSQK